MGIRKVLAILFIILAGISIACGCIVCNEKKYDVGYSVTSGQTNVWSFSDSGYIDGAGTSMSGLFASSPKSGMGFEANFAGKGIGCFGETTDMSYTKSFEGLDPRSYQQIKITSDNKLDQYQVTTTATIGNAFSGIESNGMVSVQEFNLKLFYDNFEGYTSEANLYGKDLGKNKQILGWYATYGFASDEPWETATKNILEWEFGSMP